MHFDRKTGKRMRDIPCQLKGNLLLLLGSAFTKLFEGLAFPISILRINPTIISIGTVDDVFVRPDICSPLIVIFFKPLQDMARGLGDATAWVNLVDGILPFLSNIFITASIF